MNKPIDPALLEKISQRLGAVTRFGRVLRAFGIPLYRFPMHWSYRHVHRLSAEQQENLRRSLSKRSRSPANDSF
jgi:hypothetical protein